MKDFSPTQINFICDHLGVDMTGLELGRLFMVNPAEIHQVYRAHRGHLPAGAQPSAFHSPGGGNLLARLGIRGATKNDPPPPTYSHDEFQRLFRGPDWQPGKRP